MQGNSFVGIVVFATITGSMLFLAGFHVRFFFFFLFLPHGEFERRVLSTFSRLRLTEFPVWAPEGSWSKRSLLLKLFNPKTCVTYVWRGFSETCPPRPSAPPGCGFQFRTFSPVLIRSWVVKLSGGKTEIVSIRTKMFCRWPWECSCYVRFVINQRKNIFIRARKCF